MKNLAYEQEQMLKKNRVRVRSDKHTSRNVAAMMAYLLDDDATFDTIGLRFKISRERIRQLVAAGANTARLQDVL